MALVTAGRPDLSTSDKRADLYPFVYTLKLLQRSQVSACLTGCAQHQRDTAMHVQ